VFSQPSIAQNGAFRFPEFFLALIQQFSTELSLKRDKPSRHLRRPNLVITKRWIFYVVFFIFKAPNLQNDQMSLTTTNQECIGGFFFSRT
jgi:hypothetical protein